MVHSKEINKKNIFASYVDKFEQSGDLAVEQAKLKLVEQIVKAMYRNGVTKAELARKLSKSRAYVTQCLQGDVNFTIESLVRIALTLNSEVECRFVPKSAINCWGVKNSYQPVAQVNFDEENLEEIAPRKENKKALAAHAIG